MIERGLAHELGGAVDLEYRAEGVICTIDIPAPQAALHGLNRVAVGVLVVEHKMMVLLMIEDILADLGCESVTAAATV